MPINVIASTTVSASSSQSTVNMTVPVGVTTQHFGILVFTTNTNPTSVGTAADFSVSGWTQRIEHPAGENNSEFGLFTRLGGHAGGSTIQLGVSTGRVTRITGIWYDTGGNDVAIMGVPQTRNGVSGSTTTVPGITTTVANQDVIVIATERTITNGTNITGWTPSAPIQDYFTDYTDASVTHYFGHFTKTTAGATGNYVATYTHASGNAVGVMLGIGVTVVPAAAKIATLIQTFSSPLDPAVWEATGSPSVTNSRLAVPADANSDSVLSVSAYDLTGSSFFVQVFPPSASSASVELHSATNRYASDNTLEWEYTSGGSLVARVRNNGIVDATDLGPYNLAVHGRFVRFRHVSGSTVAFDTSLDATSWTQRATKTASWDLTRVYVGLVARGSTGQMAYFDNVNTVPPTPSVTAVWSSEASSSALSLGWTTSNATSARAVISTNSSLTSPTYSTSLTPSVFGNVTWRFTGLLEEATYYVGIEIDGVLSANGRGTYRTLKTVLANSKVIAGSCNVTGSTHSVFTRIKTEAPDFFTHMGDIHYADTNVETTWRAAFKSSIESSTFQPMLQTVTMTYDWDNHDTGGNGSDKDDGWAAFAPQAVRELTGPGQYPDPKALYRTWAHAGVRYIELDRWAYRDQEDVANAPTKTMLGSVQRAWLIDLLQTASEPAIIIFAGFPHYSNLVASGRWGSYPDERVIIGNAISALPVSQRNKIVTISGDSHAVHADDGANAMWGLPNLCASPLNQSGAGAASGIWDIGNIDADDARGYFSRLTWTHSPASYALFMTWDAVRDDGTVVMTWSKSFPTIVDQTGWMKDPTATGGKRAFIRRRNGFHTSTLVDGGNAGVQLYSDVVDGQTPAPATSYDSTIDGGGVSG